jgi:putative hemolysin
MNLYLAIAAVILATAASFYFSTLTYALRDFSRSKLADHLGLHNGDRWFEHLTERTDQCIFVTAVCRMLANLILWSALYAVLSPEEALLAAALLTLCSSIALPLALARHAAETVIGYSAPLLHGLSVAFSPLLKVMTALDAAVKRILGVRDEIAPEQIEQEIMSVVEEGEKEGVVDEQERELIENVIDFRDTAAGHIMTPRPQIVALEFGASLDEVRSLIETSGHSRLPIYDGSLDKIVGMLYARDLIRSLSQPDRPFDMRSAMRPAVFVPETKPLRNLLHDFRHQKVHVAIVLDEYGGTAGLVTIEDVLEELVGEISDEHEPSTPALFRKTGESSAEADARLPIAELNAQLGLALPEDAGYETLGGYLMNILGRIPEKGAVHESDHARFTVLEAQPQRIVRVRIDLFPAEKRV